MQPPFGRFVAGPSSSSHPVDMAGHAGMAMTHRPPQGDHQCPQAYHVTSQAPAGHSRTKLHSSSSADLDYIPPRKMARRTVSPLMVDMDDAMPPSSTGASSSRQVSHHSQQRTDILNSSGSGAGASAAGSTDHQASNSGDSKKGPKRSMFPKEVTAILREWLMANLQHPFPTEDQKRELMARTGLTLLQINNWFINARRRTVQPLIDEQNRRYMQSREFSALSHYHHHHHHQPPPLAIPRLAGPSGVPGDYGVVAAPGAWVQGVHFDPHQSPTVTAASGPVVLHHPTAATAALVAQQHQHQHHQQQQQQQQQRHQHAHHAHHAHHHPHHHQQQGMVLAAAGSIQPANMVDSHSDLSLSAALPTPPSLTSNPPLSPITLPGYHMSSASMQPTIVTHSPTGPSPPRPSLQYQTSLSSTYHLQTDGGGPGGVYVPGAPGQTILTAGHPPHPSQAQMSPLTTPPSTAPTFYTFNHPSSPYTPVQHHNQQ